MGYPERAVFLKQSGESLSDRSDANWTVKGLESVVKEIAQAYNSLEELGISGLTIIPGAGNIGRGRAFPKKMKLKSPDSAGRFGTALNAEYLGEFLERAGIPTHTVLAPGMGMFDRNFNPAPYGVQVVKDAHDRGQVVIIAGGTGEDNKTTDHAVVFYARDYKQRHGGEVIILKSTRLDGVYESNPEALAKGEPEPAHYQVISANEMLADYDRFAAVDKDSLELLEEGSGLSLRIYKEGAYKLVEVLRHEVETPNTALGTLVVAGSCKPIFYA